MNYEPIDTSEIELKANEVSVFKILNQYDKKKIFKSEKFYHSSQSNIRKNQNYSKNLFQKFFLGSNYVQFTRNGS